MTSTTRSIIEQRLRDSAVPHPDAATYAALLDARDRIDAMIRAAAVAVDVIQSGTVARLRQEAENIRLLPEVLADKTAAIDGMIEAIEEIAERLPDGDEWMIFREKQDHDPHAINVLEDGLLNAEWGAEVWNEQYEKED
jgi:hypothetical protein